MRIVALGELVVLSLLLHHVGIVISTSVVFSSSPDPPTIAEGDTAAFNCSSNDSAVLINWLLNRTLSALTFTSLGVIVNGVSTTVSSLIIPGLVDPFNDTEVQCVAVGLGIDHCSPSSVILRVQHVQGIPSEVGNLTCEQTDDDCIECNWVAPFSQTMMHYTVTVQSITFTNSSTTARYCPEKYGQYTISVVAINSAGSGIVSFNIVKLIPNTKWRNVHVLTSSTRKGHWNFTFNASTTSFLAGVYNIIAHFNDTTNATGSAEVDYKGQVNGTIRTGRLDERKWNMSISIEHDTSNILISELVGINTFGVHKGNVTLNGSRICVEIEFIDESDTMECLVEYKCNHDHSHDYIIITRDNPHGCTEDVSPNNYTVILYAGRFNESNKIFAVSSITLITETSSVILLSSTFVSPNANENFEAVMAIGILVLFSIIAIICISSMVLFSKKNKRARFNKEKHDGAGE